MNTTTTSASKVESRRDKSERLHAAFPDIADRIATELGGEVASNNEYSTVLALPDQIFLVLYLDGHRGRITASVKGQKDYRGQIIGAREVTRYSEKFVTEISFAAEKSAKLIAGDITRRLLPDAKILCDRIQAAVDRGDYAVDQCGKLSVRFAELLGCGCEEVSEKRQERTFYPELASLSGTSVQVSADSVQVKFSAAPEVAERVLKFLATL